MEKHSRKQSAIFNYLFTALIVVALVVVYLLTGQRDSASAGAPLFTPAASPTATPFGRSAYALVEDLKLHGIAAAQDGNEYLLSLDGADNPMAGCRLTLSISDGFVSGFVLAFPAVPQPDKDESAISAMLQDYADQQAAAQAEAMEQVLLAVFAAYDTEDALPATVRSEWDAQFLALQNAQKGAQVSHGRFHFVTYTSGSGDAMRLCCSVLFE